MAIGAITVVGDAELRAALRDAGGPQLVRALTAAHKNAAAIVASRAVVPVGATGRLKASVRPLGSQKYGRVRAGSATVPYAAAIHWGRKIGNVGRPPGNHKGPNVIRGRPFLTDSLARNERAVVREFEQQVDQIVDRINGAHR